MIRAIATMVAADRSKWLTIIAVATMAVGSAAHASPVAVGPTGINEEIKQLIPPPGNGDGGSQGGVVWCVCGVTGLYEPPPGYVSCTSRPGLECDSYYGG